MATPAVNRNESMTRDGSSGYWDVVNGGFYFMTTMPEADCQVLTEYRPASTSNPKDASGWRAPSEFSHSYSFLNPKPLTSFVLGLPYGGDLQPCWIDGAGWNETSFGLPAFPGYLVNAAVNKALLRLKDEKVSLSQNFAERKQVESLAFSAANKSVELIAGLIKLTKGKFSPRYMMKLTAKKIRRAPRGSNTKGLLNDFLEVQYGVRPLIQDLYGAIDILHKKEDVPHPYRATVHGATRENIATTFFKPCSHTGYFGYDCQVSGDHGAYVRLDYKLDHDEWRPLTQLGLTNPAELVWEEIPFSFVVDWFVPVGNFLSAMDAALGWQFVAGSVSTRSQVEVYGKVPTLTHDGAVIYPRSQVFGYQPYSEKRFSFLRQTYPSSPWPEIPRFKNPLSGEHVANAIALVMSRIRY